MKQLSTANGLSDNNVNCAVTDQNGFLWVGTDHGLNVYDGYQVRSYFKEQFPGICTNEITTLFCDSKNRIWAGSTAGVTLVNANRQFSIVPLNDSIKTNYNCHAIFETSGLGIVQITNKGNYYLDEKNNKWVLLSWSTKELRELVWRDHNWLEGDLFIETGRSKLIILDYKQQKKIIDLDLAYGISACKLNDDEIIVALFKGRLVRISISQHKIIKEYPLVTTINNKIVNTDATSIRRAANGDIIVGTGLGGIYIFNPVTETLTQLTQTPMYTGPNAVNVVSTISCDTAGNVFIVEPGRRLLYFNVFKYNAGNISNFSDKTGKEYYDYITCIKQDAKGRLWFGGKDCLLMQDDKNRLSRIYRYYYPVQDAGERPMPIQSICFDKKDRPWVATHAGIALLNEQTGEFTSFNRDTVMGRLPNFSNNFVDDLQLMPDGKIWCATYSGFTVFDPDTYQYDSLHANMTGKDIPRRRLFRIYRDKKENIWLGSASNGVFRYDKSNGQFKKFSKAEGLVDNWVNALTADKENNIYVATPKGLSVINTSGKITNYTSANGLRYDDCQSLLTDSTGNIWIGSHSVLLKFNPSDRSFDYYDEKDGLSGENFRPNAAATTRNMLYWGTEKGYTFFSPEKLSSGSATLHAFIYQAEIIDSLFHFTSSGSMSLSPRQNTITFFFSTIDIYSEKNIQYQYSLENQDKEWVNSGNNRQVRYNSLRPGKYVFKVRSSRDGVNWTEAANNISIIIHPAFWQTWWFKGSLLLFIALGTWWLYRRRIGKVRKDERLKNEYEKKIAETEMQALRAQMNPHFMFNSLNSINNFILKNDPDNASGYLTKFSRLMRLILDNSRSEWVLLENELKALQLYIELEAVRFDDAFIHSLEITGDINPERVTVPPLLIQPYVENAIWHGLLHRKEPGGRLDIKIWKNNDKLYIEIEDNGVGRDEAKRLKSKTATRQKSHGMKITAERMEIVNKVYNVDAGVTITDLGKDGGNTGTRVLLTLKYKTHDSHYSG